MENIWEKFKQNEQINSLLTGFRAGVKIQYLSGSLLSLQRMVMAYLRRETGSPVLYIVENQLQATKVREDLATFLPQDKIVIFPPLEVLPYEVIARSWESRSQRLSVLNGLIKGEDLVVIAPIQALLTKLVPAEMIKKMSFALKVGACVELEQIINDLLNLGYERVEMVEAPGQFSVRGGIIDIYSLVFPLPIRLELFDNEVDSIREFDPFSQRSLTSLTEYLVFPAEEGVFSPVSEEKAKQLIRQDLNRAMDKLSKSRRKSARDKLKNKIEDVLRQIEEGLYFPTLESYLSYYGDLVSLADYFPENSLVWVEEPLRVREAMLNWQREVAETHLNLLKEGMVLPKQIERYFMEDNLSWFFQSKPAILSSFLTQSVPNLTINNYVNLTSQPVISFYGKLDLLWRELSLWKERQYKILIIASTEERANRLAELCRERNIFPILAEEISLPIPDGSVLIAIGSLSAGFNLPDLRLVIISDGEIFSQVKKKRLVKKSNKQGMAITRLEDLSVGDYIVHETQGIGRYLGVETLVVNGVKKDYLHLKYANQDKLYLPVEQLSKIQKYVGIDDSAPKLSKLGGTEWLKVKKKVKKSVEDLAAQLLKLYAARETITRPGASPDTVWQKEFEDAFPFTETPDQLQAINEIKKDLESNKPMDRLLCGDVGYGKTEVAIRAAFKMAMDGKQTAVLVPTTILAEQHGNTFRERFKDFPVTVEVLNRFRSPKEQKEILAKLKTGAIDVIIGTHRLLQKDVKFKNLGLLIIDEEQRFGVSHKEKIKQLKTNLDVLTLTATPIPRTLYMSLMGIRDISIIDTPPEDRFPVQTFVVEYNEGLIRDVILREIGRGGQVYFVHNRVQTIDRVVAHLQKLVPEARFAVAHGQMSEDDLEQTMISFLEGKQDVLVCTTIIEIGLDIPNVNTLIVDNADQLGLAQLYQLRGRIGRSNRTAYAYLTYRRNKAISEVAEKRLQAIKEFTDFGAGYKIAMRDLEIRGAGNLLGAEQHGHIAAVGFSLYCRMLEDAIRELKGEEQKVQIEPSVELAVDAYLPEDYISDNKQKIEIYKRIADAQEVKEVEEIYDELIDRFGDLPEPAANLLIVAKLKLLAKNLGITQLSQEKEVVVLKFQQADFLLQADLPRINKKYRGKLNFLPGKIPACQVKVKGMDSSGLLSFLEEVLTDFIGSGDLTGENEFYLEKEK